MPKTPSSPESQIAFSTAILQKAIKDACTKASLPETAVAVTLVPSDTGVTVTFSDAGVPNLKSATVIGYLLGRFETYRATATGIIKKPTLDLPNNSVTFHSAHDLMRTARAFGQEFE